MRHLNRLRLQSVLAEQPREYQVQFIKKDGTKRVMHCLNNMPGNGGQNNVVKATNTYMTVYDTEVRGFRTVNLATVLKITTSEGTKFKIDA